jgi:hypothetical protein
MNAMLLDLALRGAGEFRIVRTIGREGVLFIIDNKMALTFYKDQAPGNLEGFRYSGMETSDYSGKFMEPERRL